MLVFVVCGLGVSMWGAIFALMVRDAARQRRAQRTWIDAEYRLHDEHLARR